MRSSWSKSQSLCMSGALGARALDKDTSEPPAFSHCNLEMCLCMDTATLIVLVYMFIVTAEHRCLFQVNHLFAQHCCMCIPFFACKAVTTMALILECRAHRSGHSVSLGLITPHTFDHSFILPTYNNKVGSM